MTILLYILLLFPQFSGEIQDFIKQNPDHPIVQILTDEGGAG